VNSKTFGLTKYLGQSEQASILFKEKLSDLYRTLSFLWVVKFRRLPWLGHVARMVKIKNSFRILVVKSLRKTFVLKDESIIKMDSKQPDCEDRI
jgi:hypothetical protein